MPLFMVYITSAMTHLEGPVRHDSLFVLNTLIQYFPDLVAEHYNEVNSLLITKIITILFAIYRLIQFNCFFFVFGCGFVTDLFLALAELYCTFIAI